MGTLCRLSDTFSSPAISQSKVPWQPFVGGARKTRSSRGQRVALPPRPQRYEWRAAQEGGALLPIGSDAHSSAQLEQIRYGVFPARRGWIEARSVVNAWTWAKLHVWLQRRRGGLTHKAVVSAR
jgi:DNA polymerase (family 10)